MCGVLKMDSNRQRIIQNNKSWSIQNLIMLRYEKNKLYQEIQRIQKRCDEIALEMGYRTEELREIANDEKKVLINK